MSRHPKRNGFLIGVVALALLGAACAPPVSPAPAASASTNCGSPDATGARVLERTNGDRAANGLGPLHWDGQLMCLASGWSQHMAATGSTAHQNLGAVLGQPAYQKYRTLGENLLHGAASTSADAMQDAWMASAGHRANILSGAFSSFALAASTGADGSIYVAVEFGG